MYKTLLLAIPTWIGFGSFAAEIFRQCATLMWLKHVLYFLGTYTLFELSTDVEVEKKLLFSIITYFILSLALYFKSPVAIVCLFVLITLLLAQQK